MKKGLEEQKICENCKFWEKPWCHRFPQTTHIRVAGHWCGEFKKRENKENKK